MGEVKNILSKAEEMALLSKLGEGEGYFAGWFGTEIPQMLTNIRNDFPIEFATKISEMESAMTDRDAKIYHLEEQLGQAEDELRELVNELAKLRESRIEILEAAVKVGCIDVTRLFSQSLVIKTKLRLRIELTDSEVELLTSML